VNDDDAIVRLEDDADRAERARNDENFDDEQWNDETADFRLVRSLKRLCQQHLHNGLTFVSSLVAILLTIVCGGSC
jgi:hypothetical protein